MKTNVACILTASILLTALLTAGGIAYGEKQVVTSGSAETVQFAVAWSTLADPAKAGEEATRTAIEALDGPAKAVVFYTYYEDPAFVPDEASQATAVKADVTAERAVANAVAEAADGAASLGCRARYLSNGGTLRKNGVSVLAIGGDQASVAAIAVPLLDDRQASGRLVAEGMKGVEDLSIIIALAETQLSVEAQEHVSVEGFIRGALEDTPEGTMLFGGNSMPDDRGAADQAAGQFFHGKPLQGYIVALGLGGPLRAFGNHTHEFEPSTEAVQVTEARDKWVVTLDDEPAMDVYRKVRGMAPEEELTSDWQHPVGVVLGKEREYVRTILDWIDAEGNDKDGKPSELPPGSLAFVAPVVEGTQLKILRGGDDADAILASAKQGIEETMAAVAEAGAQPVICLLSNCRTRGMRLRTLGEGQDEVTDAILPALEKEIPLFGFYAWGEWGRIRGTYQDLAHQYQQHTFVTAVLAVDAK